jgi:CHAT domain-containing protein/tetratricopeptide (TPR) repeat protein
MTYGRDDDLLARQRRRLFEECDQYLDQGRFSDAIAVATNARDAARRYLGEQDPGYARTLNKLAVVYSQMGDYAAALPLCRQALEIRRAGLGEGHTQYAQSLVGLAIVHRAMGDYAPALPLLQRALEIRRAALGEGHPIYAQTLNNLAFVYEGMGDYAGALPLYRQALEIIRATKGESHLCNATPLNNMAYANMRMLNYAEALALLQQSGQILRDTVGEGHPHYALHLHNVAIVHIGMEDYGTALTLLHQAADAIRAALGESHPHYAIGLAGLATVHRAMGGDAAALPLLQQVLQIRRAALGEAHPDTADSLDNLATLFAAMGRATEALPLLEQAAVIEDQRIGQVFSIGSERQRRELLSVLMGRFYRTLSLVLQHFSDSPSAVRSALDLALRRKALTAEATATQRNVVLGGKYPDLRPKLQELDALRMQIARAALAGPGPEKKEIDQEGPFDFSEWMERWRARFHRELEQRKRLSELKERLEAELAQQIPELTFEQKLQGADRRAVALGLPEGMALVEFVRLHIYNFRAVPARGEQLYGPARYVAFVLPGGNPDEVRMLDLGEAEAIDRMVADFRAGVIAADVDRAPRDMGKRPEEVPPPAEMNLGPQLGTMPCVPEEDSLAHADELGVRLRIAIFDTLRPALGDRTQLLIAPDGDLARLPFEVLPDDDGRRIIDNFKVSYLSCGRDVLRFGTTAHRRPGAPLIVVDPDFDLQAATASPSSPPKSGFWSRMLRRIKRSPQAQPRQEPAPDRSTHLTGRRSRDLDAIYFDRLPGTQAEGRQIGSLLGVEPWLDAAATEGRLKATCHSPRILHLATHGFFLPDQELHLVQGTRHMYDMAMTVIDGRFAGVPVGGPLMENPMLRSGLALAGANTFLRAGNLPEEAEDGLLTAEDVTGLDLLATELVVLSACDTGLGQVHVGEGVFGLRRAFVLAGAKTLVMSLWKVPDEPTRELMEDFYGRLLAGEGRAEALRQAQLAMEAKYPDPFYWGAFICQGDPGPLASLPGLAPDASPSEHQDRPGEPVLGVGRRWTRAMGSA